VSEGFKILKKRRKLETHVGRHGNAYNRARGNCEAHLNQKQYIWSFIVKSIDRDGDEYQLV